MSNRANKVYALTTHQLQVGGERVIDANQVYAPTTHQLQVERVKVPIKWMRPTHTPATGGGES